MDQSHFTEDDLMSFNQVETTDIAPQSERAADRGSLKGPLYIKVNVKFPLDYSNPRKGFTTFWYDGPYLVHTIENNFTEDGDFSQTLNLYAMKTDIYGSVTAKDDPSSGGNIQINPPIPSDDNAVKVDDLLGSVGEMSGISIDLDETTELVKNALELLKFPDLSTVPTRRAIERLPVDDVKDKINSVKGKLEKYQGFIQGAAGEVQRLEELRGSVKGVLNQKSTMRVIAAAEREFDLLKRLNIDPNNIANVISKKAPILSETWVSGLEALETAQQQFERLRGSYEELRKVYSQILDITDSIK
jgi:hypothetical protein